MNIQQLITPASTVTPINARTVKPSKLVKPSKVAIQIEALRLELSTLTNAPCSPLMGVESLTKAIAKAKLPQIEEVEVEEVEVEEKVRVIPSKPQGIGAHCVSLLKGGMKPKDVLINALITFPNAKTSMACVYWYASKIKQGLL